MISHEILNNQPSGLTGNSSSIFFGGDFLTNISVWAVNILSKVLVLVGGITVQTKERKYRNKVKKKPLHYIRLYKASNKFAVKQLALSVRVIT